MVKGIDGITANAKPGILAAGERKRSTYASIHLTTKELTLFASYHSI
jgi:hypothetical protein